MTHSVDLLGHPLPEPKDLPREQRLSSFDGLIGHTITHIFDNEDCINDQMVIVTETRCHLAVNAREGRYEDDAPYIETLEAFSFSCDLTIDKYVKPDVLAQHGFMGAKAAADQKRAEEIRLIKHLRLAAAASRETAEKSMKWAQRDEDRAAELEAKLQAETGGAA